VRTTSNPAFRNLPTANAGYATFDRYQGGMPGSQPQETRTRDDQRPMTIDDVVTKTGITLAVLLVTGAVTWALELYALALPAALIGFVLALVITFKKVVSPPLILAYAALEGVFLGAVSGIVNARFDGIVIQAVIGTAAVFGGMLVVYRTGAIRVTPKFTKWLVGAMIGVVALMLVNLLGSLIGGGDGLGLRTPTPLGIAFSLLCIGIAAFSFLLDFDAADQAIRGGAPAKYAWYVAFGLTVTLVWLYLEILRLLSYFRE
jgi:uncharacterized YccA/Bax inhibitor family protein